MIIAKKENDAELVALAPSIKSFMNEWQIVNINIMKDSVLSQEEIIQRFYEQYKQYDGMIYPVSQRKIIMLVRLGSIDNYAIMKGSIERNIPEYCCRILLRKMSSIGLKQMQVDLAQKTTAIDFESNLYAQRSLRQENVILIADDDPLVRKSMSALLKAFGEVHEVENGNDVIGAYLEHNPDIVLLDIHMPNKTGLELIPQLVEMDSDAFIIILSADSQKDNVLIALENGAAGFLTKPPAKKNVQEYLNQCITIR